MKRDRKRWLIGVCSLCAVIVAFAGCQGDKKSGKNTSETLIFSQGADPRGLDPGIADEGESSKVNVQMYEGLLAYKKDSSQVEGCLAKSWDISENGLEYVFYLREGVKFHDGTDFDGEAVKFNVERQTIYKTEDMAYADFVYGVVDHVEVMDKYIVKIILKEPCTPFLNNLAMAMGAPMVSPAACEKYDNNLMEHPVGTGPYKFVRWDKKEAIILERNEEYWGEKPKAKQIVVKTIEDNSARVLALLNKEADIIDGIDATMIEKVKNGGGNVYFSPGMNTCYMAYNTTRLDRDTRKAISQAVNVEELVENLFQGYAKTAHSILPEVVEGYSDEIRQTTYAPKEAKDYLKAKNVTKIHAITYTNARPYNPFGGQILAEAVQGYLAKVGVDMVIDAYDWTTYRDKMASGDYDVCFYGWFGDNGDADNFMSLLETQDPAMNLARYKNPKYNKLAAQARKTKKGEERNGIYKQMEEIAADDNVWLLFCHNSNASAYREEVKNYSYHVTGNIFLKNIYKDE